MDIQLIQHNKITCQKLIRNGQIKGSGLVRHGTAIAIDADEQDLLVPVRSRGKLDSRYFSHVHLAGTYPKRFLQDYAMSPASATHPFHLLGLDEHPDGTVLIGVRFLLPVDIESQISRQVSKNITNSRAVLKSLLESNSGTAPSPEHPGFIRIPADSGIPFVKGHNYHKLRTPVKTLLHSQYPPYALELSGSPGIGKQSTIFAILSELGWAVFLMKDVFHKGLLLQTQLLSEAASFLVSQQKSVLLIPAPQADMIFRVMDLTYEPFFTTLNYLASHIPVVFLTTAPAEAKSRIVFSCRYQFEQENDEILKQIIIRHTGVENPVIIQPRDDIPIANPMYSLQRISSLQRQKQNRSDTQIRDITPDGFEYDLN